MTGLDGRNPRHEVRHRSTVAPITAADIPTVVPVGLVPRPALQEEEAPI
jgi:hypothetical protein